LVLSYCVGLIIRAPEDRVVRCYSRIIVQSCKNSACDVQIEIKESKMN